MKMTRRKLAATVFSSAVATALAQTQPTPEDDLKAARDRIKANSETLAKQVVPMDIEPAIQFKA